MFSWQSRRERRKGRGRGRARPACAALESLEGRELLAYTPLGVSLPDLVVEGFTTPAATWGGLFQVTLDVKNQGASTLIEPFALQPGATSTADAAPTTVAVVASPRKNSNANQVILGTIDVPAIPQNSVEQFTQTLVLPPRPANFPGDGGRIFIHFIINPNRNVLETDFTNNISGRSPVRIEAPLPELAAVALGVPPVMQPGDTIQPNIQVANLGTTDTSLQGPFTVALVASVDRKFGAGDSVVGLYQVGNISPLSTVAAKRNVFGAATLDPRNNIHTINGAPVTLPTSPRRYFLGVVVDPTNQIKTLGKLGKVASARNFSLVQTVGPRIRNLPPAGVVVPGGGANNLPFPFTPTGAAVGFPASLLPTGQVGTVTGPTGPVVILP